MEGPKRKLLKMKSYPKDNFIIRNYLTSPQNFKKEQITKAMWDDWNTMLKFVQKLHVCIETEGLGILV